MHSYSGVLLSQSLNNGGDRFKIENPMGLYRRFWKIFQADSRLISTATHDNVTSLGTYSDGSQHESQ
jgi:hypothetical protein